MQNSVAAVRCLSIQCPTLAVAALEKRVGGIVISQAFLAIVAEFTTAAISDQSEQHLLNHLRVVFEVAAGRLGGILAGIDPLLIKAWDGGQLFLFEPRLVVAEVGFLAGGDQQALGVVGDDEAFTTMKHGTVADLIEVDEWPGVARQAAALMPADPDRAAPGVGRMVKLGFELDRGDLGVKRFATSLDCGRQLGFGDAVKHIHHVAAHVADLTDSPVPEHIPLQTIRARKTREIVRMIWVFRRGPEPQIPVQTSWRFADAGIVAVTGKLAVSPRGGGLEVADSPIEHHLLDSPIVRLGMHLGAALGGELALVGEPVRAQGSGLLDAESQGFFAKNTEATIHRPVGNKGVVVVGSTNDHRIEPLMIETFSPVYVSLGLGKNFERMGQVGLIDVAERDHILLCEPTVVGAPPAPRADKRDVELIIGRRLAANNPAG